jgi:aspartate aminotransferase
MTKPAQNIFKTSERVATMQASSTLGAMQKALTLRAEGVDVVDLGAGEPDFDTPDHVKLAAQEAMSRGETKYTATGGTRALQQSIIDYYAREFGAGYEPAEVMATAGGKQAIFNAVVTLANPDDEILVAKPYWVTFPEIAKFAGAMPIYIETEHNGFQLTAEDVRASITPRTKLIIINSPSNPSGRVVPPAEFRKIMEVCAERGVYVVSDECYLRFVYAPGEVFSAASLPAELRARLCIAGSFSKTYAMTGWRIGYALAPAEWIKAMLLVQGHSTSNPNSVAQAAAAAAMNAPQDCVREMLDEYARRREWLIGALAGIPGFKCFAPEGAFYAFPDVRGCLKGDVKTSAEFAEKLLTDEHVVVTDGAGFGADGYLRVSYATSLERLKEGVERIRRVAEACAR